MSARGWTTRIHALTAFGGLLLAGCGGGGGEGTPDGGFSTCATDLRATPYQPGMTVTSQTGAFIVKLLSSTPGPPVKGQNTWVVEVDEAAGGTPLDGAELTVSPFMPDHQHPTTRPVVVTPAGGGTYTFNPVYLFMSGYWEVRMNVASATVASGAPDLAMLPICIP